MRHVADRFVVVLDANVLYPFRMRDLLLRFYQAGLYRGRWTDKIIAEWTDNLLRQKPALAASIAAQQRQLAEHFPEAYVTGYEPLMAGLTLPDPDDVHVLAAAIKCGAQQIVTQNLKDFPAELLDPHDIEAIDADEFLSRTWDLYPAEGIEIVKQLRHTYRNPPFTESEMVLDITANGLPKLASRLRQVRSLI